MKRTYGKILPLALAVLAGAAGGILRGMELTVCYDDKTGLYIATPVTWTLLGLSAAAAVFFLILSLMKKAGNGDYVTCYRCGMPGALLGMLSELLMTAAGFLRIVSFFSSGKYSALFLGILTALCGVSIIALTIARRRGELPYMTGFGAVVTVFWGCFMLIQVFMEHPVEPVILLFAYDLLAMCFVLLSLYGSTAQIFGKNRVRVTLFSSLAAVYLLLVSGFGRLVTFLMTGSLYYVLQVPFRMMVYAALLPYCMQNAASLLLHMDESVPQAVPEGETKA